MRALFLQRPNRQVLLAAFGSIYPVASDRYPLRFACQLVLHSPDYRFCP
jgi:hypothetical protein